MGILSYAGQTHRSQSNVVEQPPFLRSDMKPLKWWAENVLVYCIDPNKPNNKPSYSQPLDALRRVATGIKIFIRDLDQDPTAYVVTRSVLANFFNDFKQKVFDVALEQDAKNGSFIEKTQKEYQIAKQEWELEQQAEAAKQAAKTTTRIFVSSEDVRKAKKMKAN